MYMNKMYFLLLILTKLTIYSQTNSNTKKIDSLEVILQDEKDTFSKINLYHSLCEEYRKKNLNKLVFYNNQLLALSKKIKYERGIGLYYYHLTFINEDLGKDRVETASKAAKIFLQVKDDKYFLKASYYLANALMNVSNYEEAKNTIKASLPLALKNNFVIETGSFYRLLGLINYYEGQLDNSLSYYKKALSYYNKSKKSSEYKADLYLYMAFTFTDLEKYKQSIHYLDLANSNGENIDVNIEKAVVLNKMYAHKEALQILLNNRRPSLYKPKNINDYNTYILGDTYYHLKDYAKAIENLKMISKDNAFFEFNIEYYNLVANCYLQLNQIKEAKLYNDKALLLIESSNISHSKQSVLLTKSQIEEKNKRFEQALFYYKKQASLKEAYNSKINKSKVHELQIDFDVAEKNNRIKNLEILQLKKDSKLSKQKDYIIFISIALLITFISIVVFVKINLASKKKNEIIEKINVALENSILEKDILLKEIHHRVKNNLQLVMSLLYVQSKQENTNLKDFIEISQSRIISMALIHENLYQTDDLSKVQFKAYIDNLTKSINASYSDLEKDIQLELAVDDIYLDIQTAIPLGLIINELVSNAYKHAFVNKRKGTISLLLKQVNDTTYKFEVNDNGIGLSKKETLKNSLGLELVKQLVTQIKGTFEVQNNLGTQYSIQFKNTKV